MSVTVHHSGRSAACAVDLRAIQDDVGRHFGWWLLIGFTILAPLTLLRDAQLGTRLSAIHLASYGTVWLVWLLRDRLPSAAFVLTLLAVLYVQGLCAMGWYGSPSQSFLAFALMILVAPITLGPRAGVASAAVCIGTLLVGASAADALAAQFAWVRSLSLRQPMSWAYAALSLTCFAGIVVGLVMRAMRHMEILIGREIERSHALALLNQELIGANEQLTSLNNELEHRVHRRTADLAAANVTLAENSEYLEMFAYSVSHDLRAPLRAIGGFSRLLDAELSDTLSPTARQFMQHIHKGVESAESMITRLLRFAQLGRMEKHVERLQLSDIAAAVVAELRAAAGERIVNIEISPGMTAMADAVLVRQLLQNLLGNCWKFTERKADAQIRFGCRDDGDRRVYVIEDNGAGFDLAEAKRLFRPFQRLHAVSEFDGTGIGLAAARRIVELHGGQIWAEGKRNAGATFFFTLPDPAPAAAPGDLT
jgi:signal transduction histidine kinase